jgi:asparagine synthase (glutamine-hydrolysing)
VPEPRTPFRAIRRIEAGTYVEFRPDGEHAVRYWDPSTFTVTPIGVRDAISETQRLVEEAVTKQVMSDVPVGVFISGGMDSSILAALASKAIGVDKVHTFSAQFAEECVDVLDFVVEGDDDGQKRISR